MTNPEQYGLTEYKGVPISIERHDFDSDGLIIIKALSNTKGGRWLSTMHVSEAFLNHSYFKTYIGEACYNSFISKNPGQEW